MTGPQPTPPLYPPPQVPPPQVPPAPSKVRPVVLVLALLAVLVLGAAGT
ncbi:MAG: hypothetical protein HOY78_03860, partial [Saccharothrix sp.]|nr:hypothetical protein [Saccharothrix sp.]